MIDTKTNGHILSESLTKLHFEMNGYFTYTNSSGKAEFDLLLSKDGKLFSAEVKSVSVIKTNTKGPHYKVQLKSVRSNTTINNIHYFDNSNIDFLVIVDITDMTICVMNAKDIVSKTEMAVYKDQFRKVIVPGMHACA